MKWGCSCRDMQSYVSRAFLYFAPVSKKVLILVDNQPWMTTKQARSARLWQFMITKVPYIPVPSSYYIIRNDHKSNYPLP